MMIRAIIAVLQQLKSQKKSQTTLVLGVLNDVQGRLHYVGAQDIYPDPETFSRFCEAVGGRVGGEITPGWFRYPNPTADPQLHFQPCRRAIAVWTIPK